jgi:hypothetical protein
VENPFAIFYCRRGELNRIQELKGQVFFFIYDSCAAAAEKVTYQMM